MSVEASTGPCFVDTNILVYAIAGDDPGRSPAAQQLLRNLMRERSLRTSTQVLQELYVTLTRKGKSPLPADTALRYIDRIAAWPVGVTDFRSVRRAIELSIQSRLSFRDALIIVAAEGCGAKTLYTEDLQTGQTLLGVLVVNPFKG
jgi:predicted nucleic acid-binding protein